MYDKFIHIMRSIPLKNTEDLQERESITGCGQEFHPQVAISVTTPNRHKVACGQCCEPVPAFIRDPTDLKWNG